MRSLLLLAVLISAKMAALAAPVDLGSAASRTPYDRYMTPVKQVLASSNQAKPSMDRVAELVQLGRSFRYVHSTPYNPATPQETAARRAGDCKDKALWLCDQMRDPSARFVIGKIKRSPKISHAWVMWQSEGRWFVLDPTLNSRPVAVESISQDDYVPLYSYGKNTTYRHARAAGLTASVANGKARVASR